MNSKSIVIMKKIILLLTLLICITDLFTQINFSNGYIITNSNDTIYGQIDLRTTTLNQEKCTFKSSTAEEHVYKPQDIKGYRFTNAGKFYISKTITVEDYQKLIFVEYLVQGGLDLFFFEYNKQKYFLFEEAGKDPIYITQIPPKEIDNKIHIDRKYIGYLAYSFRNSSPEMLNSIKKSAFNQSSMIAIAKQYNDENCLNPEENSCIIFENKKPDFTGVMCNISVYTGVQIGSYDGYYRKGRSTFPMIGAQLYIINPRWSNSIGGVIDLSFSKIDSKSPTKEAPKEDTHEYRYKNYFDYDLFNLSAKLGLRYTFGNSKLRPSLEGGFSSSYFFKNSSTKTFVSNRDENIESKLDVRKFHHGGYISARLEYRIKKSQAVFLQFNYDYYLKAEYTPEGLGENLKLMHIKVGYTF